ncbi:MAG: L,D-transpeptidase family protein [Roseovarius sp.]|nr:L,D-transpeptidase family protein [Roseovarius sp.]
MALLAAMAGCGSNIRSYDGPEVTSVLVKKEKRRMHLLHHGRVLKSYRIDLGFEPVGHKQFEGDGKTPVGNYIIDRRNPNSKFHRSLGISYPNGKDAAFARSSGKSPGGDIFIHGRPNNKRGARLSPDWTAGCIAVGNRQIEEIYSMVKIGTPIAIRP